VASRLDPVEPLALATFREEVRTPRVWSTGAKVALVIALAALALGIVAGVMSGHDDLGPGRVLGPVVVGAWAGSAAFVAVRRPREPLGIVIGAAALTGALALFGAALVSRRGGSDDTEQIGAFVRAFAVGTLPAVGLHLALGLPDGALRTRLRRTTAAAGYGAGFVAGAVMLGDRPSIRLGPLVLVAGMAAVAGVAGFVARARGASTEDRTRLQWVAWGVVVAVAVSAVAWILHELIEWPGDVPEIAVATTVLVPLSLAFGASERIGVRIDRLLVHTITLAGLVVMVAATYLLVVLGLGREPTSSEKTLLGASMVAAAVAALLWVPVRSRLVAAATRRVYGERHDPVEVLRTFGTRLTRALPLDELLLQLAESLKQTMALESAEVWTRSGSHLDRSVSVPERGPASISIGAEAETVIARAGVSGATWARMWMPSVLRGAEDEILRVAPITNSGELLGMLVVRRAEGDLAFEDDDDQALTDLARQVGLALHNVKLDSALQESLDEVRRQADELRASRARIVEAGDAQRREIERDLHDGAQQHLVALAVNVNLARQLADSDLETAKSMLEQVGHDLQDAVQELRNLAHGIYPPLLLDRGLRDALAAAAARASLPTDLLAEGIGRYPQAVEAAIYFCCLEALQNAAKHAGEDANVTISVREEEGALVFRVADDGAGFDLASGAARRGHGFVNMGDRVGAIGGSLTVDSAPGAGTRIEGRVPLSELAPPPR
jgi:signal transduction histidine kinase